MKNLRKIKGDASFRKFFRKKNNNDTSVIVFAKKEKYKKLPTNGRRWGSGDFFEPAGVLWGVVSW